MSADRIEVSATVDHCPGVMTIEDCHHRGGDWPWKFTAKWSWRPAAGGGVRVSGSAANEYALHEMLTRVADGRSIWYCVTFRVNSTFSTVEHTETIARAFLTLALRSVAPADQGCTHG